VDGVEEGLGTPCACLHARSYRYPTPFKPQHQQIFWVTSFFNILGGRGRHLVDMNACGLACGSSRQVSPTAPG